MTTDRHIWVDGQPGGLIPADDPGLLYGLTAFETMRCYDRSVFRLEDHLDRLAASAEQLEVPLPPRALVAEEIRTRAEPDSALRYTLTAGGRRILQVEPIDPSRVGAPMRVARVEWEPSPWLPGLVKHGSRAAWIIAARRLGVDEVILVDRQGNLLEANRSNLFGVRDGVIRTPALDGRLLAGVTRGALLDAARQAGLPLREGPMPQDEGYDELYCSSTLKELAPIAEMDGRPGPGGGPVGAALLAAFRRLVANETGG
jgi:branched-subunit amino acid aminotransferase/4-amino-4-deoxychorismate lyase